MLQQLKRKLVTLSFPWSSLRNRYFGEGGGGVRCSVTPGSELGGSTFQEVSKCGEATPPPFMGFAHPDPASCSGKPPNVPSSSIGRGEPRRSPEPTNLPAGGGLAEVGLQARPLPLQESQAAVGLAQEELPVLQLPLGLVLARPALPKGHCGGVELLLGGVELLLGQALQVPALFQAGLQVVGSFSQDMALGRVVTRCLLELPGGLQVWRESGCG